ncbi:MAG TPA: hypothetical protein VJ781_10515, partial [Pyrinomonadaceae bacterium]|nr:hypothetical protein [Pyrinomonadaceae bacterium]
MKLKMIAAHAAIMLCVGIFVSGQTVQKTPEEVAQSLVDAYNARRMDGILKAYSPDSVAYALPSGEIILKGHDAI